MNHVKHADGNLDPQDETIIFKQLQEKSDLLMKLKSLINNLII